MKNFLTPKEVAALLEVTTNRVCSIMRNGKLRSVRVGSSWRTTVEWLREYLAEFVDSASLRRLEKLLEARAHDAVAASAAPRALAPKEVAERLGVSLNTVYTLLKNHDLHGFKVGKAWRVREDVVERFTNAPPNPKQEKVRWFL
jgi:excisionase family DNA binding protein